MFRKGDEPIPGYRLEQFLGKGQFGEVWRTSAPGGTSAALKFIDLGGKQGVKEFRGVKRVKEIRHANLMPITALWMLDAEGNTLSNKAIESYDPEVPSARETLMVAETTVSTRPEWLVVAMLLGKKNLMDRLNECVAEGKEGIPADELLRYMEEAAKGIDYLNTPQHDLGEGIVAIQHCDIKPANIMLIGDAAVVCDFGLARVLTDAAATATGMVGSPAYMAPENILRKPGPGSDQYALAVSYVELRTGQLPFKELSYVEVLEANRQAKLDLSRLSPSEQVVIRKATALRPEDRYPSAVAMVQALRRAVEGTPELPRSGARPAFIAAAVFLAIALPVGSWLALKPRGGNGFTPATYTLTFEPSDVQVVLNGAPQALSDGTLSIPLAPGVPVSIEATGPTGYLPLNRQFTLDELQQADFRIQLGRDGQYYAQRAYQLLESGDFAAAVAEYKHAVDIDSRFQRPEPIKLATHSNLVQALAISRNGKWLVSAGDDRLACLWSLAQPAEAVKPIVLRGHAEPIEAVAISTDNRWVVTGSWDNTAMVWDLDQLVSDPSIAGIKLEGHEGDVVATAITPDVRWIVTAGGETVRLWPIDSGTPSTRFRELVGHKSEIQSVRVSTTGRWLVTIDTDGEAFRWDLSSPNPESSKFSLGSVPHSRNVLQLTPDERWLVTGDERGSVHIHALDGQTRHRTEASSDKLESLAIASTGTQLFVGDATGNVVRLDVSASGKAENPVNLGAHLGACVAIALAPDGTYCVTGGYGGQARLWESTQEKKPPVHVTLDGKEFGRVNAIAVTPDGKWIAVATESGPVLLWNAARCRMILHATGGEIPVRAPTTTPTT